MTPKESKALRAAVNELVDAVRMENERDDLSTHKHTIQAQNNVIMQLRQYMDDDAACLIGHHLRFLGYDVPR